ncbi:MAG: S8 family serine peptidase, partial [Chloroflexi bacterium]|nr:S8 family serine peptidase [Chloroflexota bacterium]
MSQSQLLRVPLTAPRDDLLICPACGRASEPVLFARSSQLRARVRAALMARYPLWLPETGVCAACVYETMQSLHARQLASLHHELQLPYPVYTRDDARLLPTPERMHAHPRYTGRGVTIAFLDSGFYPHPDLTRPKNRILCYVDATGVEPIEKTHFKKPRLSSWHGLMTSCAAAGNGFLSDGMYRGIASRANLVLIKTGSQRTRRISDRSIYRALSWVIANVNRYDIRIVNISLGGDQPAASTLSPLEELVEETVARGMVVVAAAGNGGAQRIYAPASAPAAITVGGLDDQNSRDWQLRRMYRSNFGHGFNQVGKPELIAPAIWVAAPMLPNTETHNEGMFWWRMLHASDREFARVLDSRFAEKFFKQRTLRLPLAEIRALIRGRMIQQKFIHAHYQHVDGTSFAAPIVSSIAAQMLEANPTLTPAQVKDILLATADPIPSVPREQQGYGVVN